MNKLIYVLLLLSISAFAQWGGWGSGGNPNISGTDSVLISAPTHIKSDLQVDDNVIIHGDGNSTVPAIQIGTGNGLPIGFYNDGANGLWYSYNGSEYWAFTPTLLKGKFGGWPALRAVTPTNTSPSLLPSSNNTTSGIGMSGGEVCIISGGSEVVRALTDRVRLTGSVKTTTGDPASPVDGDITINTFDNAIKIYADGAWRTLATW